MSQSTCKTCKTVRSRPKIRAWVWILTAGGKKQIVPTSGSSSRPADRFGSSEPNDQTCYFVSIVKLQLFILFCSLLSPCVFAFPAFLVVLTWVACRNFILFFIFVLFLSHLMFDYCVAFPCLPYYSFFIFLILNELWPFTYVSYSVLRSSFSSLFFLFFFLFFLEVGCVGIQKNVWEF
jgi:hypothetical protein